MSKKTNKSNSNKTPELKTPSPGKILSRARKEKGLTEQDVLSQLGITSRAFSALEKDEYDKLPSLLYIKGYIRRYCFILGLSEEKVIPVFDELTNELGIKNKEPVLRLEQKIKTKITDKKPFNLKVAIAVLLIIFAALSAALYIVKSTSDSALEDSLEKATLLFGSKAEGHKIEENSPKEVAIVDNTNPDLSTNPDAETENINEQSIAKQVIKSKVEPQLGNQPIQSVALSSGMDILEIMITEPSWVEVLDARGDILLADLKNSGYQNQVTGKAPFEVTLGYAPGVQLILNGKKVEISSIGNNNTAKLKIGD